MRCTRCAETIPAQRRRAVPGCQMCVACKVHAERRGNA
ncbi:TraR/DksA C4-type zinc finger protein [Acidovorax sp.]|nr:TraR/DksA C4-type zinc finger protein [Acidovorax sp.]MDZ7862659.1 TraR/DksA C4-type zinc finger protein [Acidovorax sp.]